MSTRVGEKTIRLTALKKNINKNIIYIREIIRIIRTRL